MNRSIQYGLGLVGGIAALFAVSSAVLAAELLGHAGEHAHAELPVLELVTGALFRVGVLATFVLLEGGLLDAERAYQKGFVNRVVPDDDVEDEARATAQRIAEGAPLVNRWHKKFVRRLVGGGGPLTEDERQEAYEAFQTDDYREGVQAFLEGRDPRFEGK